MYQISNHLLESTNHMRKKVIKKYFTVCFPLINNILIDPTQILFKIPQFLAQYRSQGNSRKAANYTLKQKQIPIHVYNSDTYLHLGSRYMLYSVSIYIVLLPLSNVSCRQIFNSCIRMQPGTYVGMCITYLSARQIDLNCHINKKYYVIQYSCK